MVCQFGKHVGADQKQRLNVAFDQLFALCVCIGFVSVPTCLAFGANCSYEPQEKTCV